MNTSNSSREIFVPLPSCGIECGIETDVHDNSNKVHAQDCAAFLLRLPRAEYESIVGDIHDGNEVSIDLPDGSVIMDLPLGAAIVCSGRHIEGLCAIELG